VFQPEPPVGDGDLGAGTESGFLDAGASAVCTDAEPGEPDTITVECSVADRPDTLPVIASDTADAECQTPHVKVDKQISCDGGATWFDQGLNPPNDGANGCSALDGTEILVRYFGENDGDVTLYACELTDTNPSFSPATVPVGTLDPTQSTGEILAEGAPECSDDLETREPNTATLNCCLDDVGDVQDCSEGRTISAVDMADLECQSTPELSLIKECVDDDGDGVDQITLTTEATVADLGLVNCQLTDEIYLDDPDCPADVGTGTPVEVAPAAFSLAAGGSQVSSGEVELNADACNTASVTCTIEGTEIELTATDDAVCPGEGQGCLTRTPGFWGNKYFVINDYGLLPLSLCGGAVALDTTNAFSGSSTTEAMCSTGRDFKKYDGGSQQGQLVRQCTAALLNVAVTEEEGGNCTGDYPSLAGTLAACCTGEDALVCGGMPMGYDTGYCIDMLDAFNNSYDTLFVEGFGAGPADSSVCRESRNNGVAIDLP
jgi:hypothetical protein